MSPIALIVALLLTWSVAQAQETSGLMILLSQVAQKYPTYQGPRSGGDLESILNNRKDKAFNMDDLSPVLFAVVVQNCSKEKQMIPDIKKPHVASEYLALEFMRPGQSVTKNVEVRPTGQMVALHAPSSSLTQNRANLVELAPGESIVVLVAANDLWMGGGLFKALNLTGRQGKATAVLYNWKNINGHTVLCKEKSLPIPLLRLLPEFLHGIMDNKFKEIDGSKFIK